MEELFDENVRRGELMKCLKGIGDIERLTGRIVYGNANCKDLAALALSLRVLPKLFDGLEGMKSQALAELRRADPLCGIEQKISDALVDDPPFSLREGGLFRKGYNEEIDRLRDLAENGRGAIANIESRERERTGIKKLRINYNKVFGYYIEVPRSQAGEVPDDYIRKQTLTNGERYITEELKELKVRSLLPESSSTRWNTANLSACAMR